MTRTRWIGLALASLLPLGMLIYGIVLFGWVIPVAVYAGIGVMVVGIIMLVRSDKNA